MTWARQLSPLPLPPSIPCLSSACYCSKELAGLEVTDGPLLGLCPSSLQPDGEAAACFPIPQRALKTPLPWKGEGKLEPQTLILCWNGPNLPIWGEHILALASSLYHFNGRKRPGFCLGKG